ncbi:hypothetical protein [Cyanobacterium sp. uoEpiScrs1]|uniref:hypothetical protein n=1 Tax=Cyanobacterium sp. uoEpiScrs1 TaxID=2976343 RepID=UPI002269AB34|nr:hypothetical protein [Cyanobacterium sp. uoEpiScrs1]
MTWKISQLQIQTFCLPIYRRNIRLLIITLLSTGLVMGIGQLELTCNGNFRVQPINAQTLRPEEVATIVYEKLSYLPKENQYIRQDTGEVDPFQTLISRLIRYHRDLKRRAPSVSLDWKITLADYLGVNESIKKDRYPGNSTLKKNPMETDVEAIQDLNRHQRQELVDLLVSIYTPEQRKTKPPTVQNELIPESSTVAPATGPRLSNPGDADLLKL